MIRIECSHWKALHVFQERIVRSSAASPRFSTCCGKGKLSLQQSDQGSIVDRIIPKLIRRLDQLTEEIGSIRYDLDCSRNF